MSYCKDKSPVTFRIKRCNSNGISNSYYQDFAIIVTEDMTILAGLIQIKAEYDPSLSFRSSCGDGICGSCAVSINGISKLACESLILSNINQQGVVEIAPVAGMEVIKDLVTEYSIFWEKYKSVEPWISKRKTDNPRKRFIDQQNVLRFDGVEKCISCGICYTSCAVSINDANFIGPHALVKAFLKVVDIRELDPESHLSNIQTIWDCTTCYQCNTLCPVDLRPAVSGIELKKMLVESYKIPPKLGKHLANIYENNNPYGLRHSDRNGWLSGLEVNDPRKQFVDACFINCCSSCYDSDLRVMAKKIIGLSIKLGVNTGCLFENEKCCGSEVQRLGEVGLFDFIAQDRMENIKNINAGEIVCISPHCYDAYKNHYPKIDTPIIHYTQFIATLLLEKKIQIEKQINKKVTYHDPCYLSYQNQVVAQPRFIIESIPGIELIEMKHNKENSLCCGGGAGNVWRDSNKGMPASRVKEAIETGAEYLVTTCPFCYLELSDAAKRMNTGDRFIKVIDLIDLLLMALRE